MRFEYKYQINQQKFHGLKDALSLLMDEDSHNGERGYHIRSVYFDDYKNSFYQGSLAGFNRRKKHRIRFYECSDEMIRYEKKVKIGHQSKKESFQLTKKEMEGLIKGQWQNLDEPTKAKAQIKFEGITKGLRPKILIAYDRWAYTLPYNQVRITFDLNVRYTTNVQDVFNKGIPLTPIDSDYYYILEVKFNHFLPNFIKEALKNYLDHPMSISKYVLCRQGSKRGY